ncbi:MAG: hypothetical protein CYG60_21700 [Actinobacteria bacterium]|nr:MAG: hypothetical protein CYG60_21700 [Actinomycetota bacterium]
MAPQCREIKPNGERCTLPAKGQLGVCWAHDPANAAQRRRTASKGGRGKPSRELQGIKVLLSDLTNQVLAGELENGRAAVANQLVNTRLRTIEVERKVKETEELEERLEALERAAEGQRGGRGWG